MVPRKMPERQLSALSVVKVLFAHVVIDYSHSQRPVPRCFPLFKCYEWLEEEDWKSA